MPGSSQPQGAGDPAGGPYPDGSRVRFLTQLAASNPAFPLPWLLDQDDTIIQTILDVLIDQAEATRR